MKITKEQLKRIIKEELSKAINEEEYDTYRDRYRTPGDPETYLRKSRIKRQRIAREREMTDLGKADAEAGNPRDENITHRAYHRAYDLEMGKEELNEIGYYGLGSEPFGAERYRERIEGFEKMLDKMSYRDPRMPQLEDAIKLSVSEILSNIEDEEVRMGVEEIVADLLGTVYLD